MRLKLAQKPWKINSTNKEESVAKTALKEVGVARLIVQPINQSRSISRFPEAVAITCIPDCADRAASILSKAA